MAARASTPVDALMSIAGSFREHMSGSPLVARRPAAGLTGVFADDAGMWRPDAPERIRALLVDVLATYREHGGRRAPVGTGATRAQVVDLIALRWGVTGHPCSAPEALRLLGLHEVFPVSTAEKWAPQVLADAAVRDRLEAEVARRRSPSLPADPMPDWDASKPDLWPFPSGNVSGTFERSAAAQLLDTARRTLREAVDADGSRSLEDWAQDASAEPGPFAVQILRDATAAAIRRWYHDGKPPGDTYLRHFRHRVVRAWYGAHPLAPARLGRAGPSGSRYPPAVAAATRLLMWQAASSAAQLTDAASARVRLQRLVVPVSSLVSIPPGTEPPGYLVDLSLVQREFAQLYSEPLLSTAGAATGALLNRSVVAHPERLLALAYAIRENRSTRDVALRFIDEYISLRPGAQEAAGRSPSAHEQLALADHSVHWDCVELEDDARAAVVAAAARTLRAQKRQGYLAHTWRSDAVLHNKRDEWAAGLDDLFTGSSLLAAMRQNGAVQDDREYESSRHQLWLAGAGITLRMLERQLLKARYGSDVVTSTARGVLAFSRAAATALTFLDSPDLGGLPPARHHDGQIASTAWRKQTRIIRLRGLLAVHTAVKAKLVRTADLTADPTGQRRATYLDPLAPLVAHADEVVALLDLAFLNDRYRELLRLAELQATDHQSIVTLAAWLAFLQGGTLPVEPQPNAQFILPVAELLDADPADIESGGHTIIFNVPEFTLWLGRRGADAGLLSWLPLDGAVARTLKKLSNDTYWTFRRRHDEHRPDAPSHD